MMSPPTADELGNERSTSDPKRIALTVLLALVVMFLSWLTILPGTPQVYAPFNLLVILPLFFFEVIFGDPIASLVATCAMPFSFYLWTRPVLRGCPTIPARSVVLLIAAILLCAAYMLVGCHFGVKHQGFGYVAGVAVVNVVCWVALSVCAMTVLWKPGFARNLGFHFALFAWLAWCAFPYMGELP